MRLMILFCIVLIAFSFVPTAHAIVLLPAVILIPIVKIVAIVIGGLSLPAAGMSALWSRMFGKSLSQTFVWAVVILLSIGILLTIWLRFYLPEHPLF